MMDDADLRPLEASALATVRRVLGSTPSAKGLEARFQHDCDLAVVPVITLHRASDGLRHAVHVQVYETDAYEPVVGIGRAYFATRDIGEGFRTVLHDDIAHGPNHRDVTTAFEAELADVLARYPDAFDPEFPPGVGGHPLAAEMVAAARAVADAHNASCASGDELSLALNAKGRMDGDDDVVSFVREDGTHLPLVLRSGVGQVVVMDGDTGETYAKVHVHHRDRLAILPEVVTHNLQGFVASSPAP